MEDYIKKTFSYTDSCLAGQFLRYAVVGGLASVVDVAVFTIGVNVLGINHLISNTISFISGLTVNYLLSRSWVFNKKTHNKTDFFLFSLIGVIGLLLSEILLFFLIDSRILYYLLASSNDSLVKPAAKVAVMVLVLFWNFFARKKIVFST